MLLDADAIASRYAIRPGCRFISYRLVGLAVFSMHVRVLASQPRDIPPLDEFVLRFLQEGISRVSEISELLGIDRDLLHNRLVELRRSELIEVEVGEVSSDLKVNLTIRGRETARHLKENTMKEMTLSNIIYHGLLRKPISHGDIAKQRYYRPKEASDEGLALVSAIPNRYPNPEEIDVKQLDAIVKRSVRRKQGAPLDIVAVKSVLKKVYTLYEKAVMLEYETLDGKHDRQVAFAVEGRLIEEYEAAFARQRGSTIVSNLLSPPRQPIEDRIKQHASPEIIRRLGKIDDAEQLATDVAITRQQVVDAKEELSLTERADTRSLLEEKIKALEEKLRNTESERNTRKVKYLWTPEIKLKLWDALRVCKSRLLILSGWISSEVVNDQFADALRLAMKRGVKVWIGYGFDRDNKRGQDQRNETKWKDAEAQLKRLSTECKGMLDYRDLGRSHEKRLICDNSYTFGGSFNLLSFSAEQRGVGKVRHEGADLIEDAEFCEALYERYLKLFFETKKVK